MPFKKTRIPRYLILEEPPRHTRWRLPLLGLLLLMVAATLATLLVAG